MKRVFAVALANHQGLGIFAPIHTYTLALSKKNAQGAHFDVLGNISISENVNDKTEKVLHVNALLPFRNVAIFLSYFEVEFQTFDRVFSKERIAQSNHSC